MNWTKYAASAAVATFALANLFAQEPPQAPPPPPAPPKAKQEEIIIRQKGDKSEKMTIVVDGDKVTVNGKPMNDFKDGNVKIINRRKNNGPFGADMQGFDDDDLMPPTGVNKAMLGVLSSKGDDGAKVNEVTKESGAEKAGLQKDDVITKIGNTKVADPKELTEAIGKYKPDEKVDITYKRNGKLKTTTATLSANKDSKFKMRFNGDDMDIDLPQGVMPPNMENFDFNFYPKPKLGIQIQDIEEGSGVKINEVEENSPAAKAGFKTGDIITQVNGKNISGVDDLKKETADLNEGDKMSFSYKRDGKTQTTELKIPKKLKTADL